MIPQSVGFHKVVWGTRRAFLEVVVEVRRRAQRNTDGRRSIPQRRRGRRAEAGPEEPDQHGRTGTKGHGQIRAADRNGDQRGRRK